MFGIIRITVAQNLLCKLSQFFRCVDVIYQIHQQLNSVLIFN